MNWFEDGGPHLIDCEFDSNSATAGGGGLYGYGPFIVEDCHIISNTADSGGGMRIGGGESVILNSVISANLATSTNWDWAHGGGGIFVINAGLFLDNCTLEDNVAITVGGGVCGTLLANIVIESSVLRNNSAEQGGGLVVIESDAEVDKCLFQQNVAGSQAGAIEFLASSGLIRESRFCENEPNTIVGEWIDEGGNNFGDACDVLGDLDVNGSVGVVDLLILLGMWGPCGECANCPADLDADCSVGVADLLILLGNWG